MVGQNGYGVGLPDVLRRRMPGRSDARDADWMGPGAILREHLSAVMAAIDAGVPVGGVLALDAGHYEWGSDEPRFGL